jgi:hypothetical protein
MESQGDEEDEDDDDDEGDEACREEAEGEEEYLKAVLMRRIEGLLLHSVELRGRRARIARGYGERRSRKRWDSETVFSGLGFRVWV